MLEVKNIYIACICEDKEDNVKAIEEVFKREFGNKSRLMNKSLDIDEIEMVFRIDYTNGIEGKQRELFEKLDSLFEDLKEFTPFFTHFIEGER